MSEFNYDEGRLDLPFVGHCTFAKAPVCTDWENIDADVAVLGVPNDMGTQWRSGARAGPAPGGSWPTSGGQARLFSQGLEAI